MLLVLSAVSRMILVRWQRCPLVPPSAQRFQSGSVDAADMISKTSGALARHSLVAGRDLSLEVLFGRDVLPGQASE